LGKEKFFSDKDICLVMQGIILINYLDVQMHGERTLRQMKVFNARNALS
jgi:predicted P-loop ATPase